MIVVKGGRSLKKRIAVGLFAIVLAFTLAACGSGSSFDSLSMKADGPMMEEAVEEIAMDSYYNGAESVVTDEGAPSVEMKTTENTSVSQRKLIKTVDLSVETKDYDNLMTSLEGQIESLGGYIESLSVYNGNYYGGRNSRNADITARIPVDKLDGFVKQIGQEANVVDRNESVEDVTLQYVDLDSHTRMLEEEQERLLELLENAASIEDIIAIESRLSEVRYQLESMKSQLRTFDNQVEYSTVHIYINEVMELTPVVELSAGERIAQGFVDSVKDVTEGIKEFGIQFIINIPYIIVWAVIIAIIAFIVIKLVKLADKRSMRIMEQMRNKKSSMTGNMIDSPYVQRPGVQSDSGPEKEE